MKKIVFSGGPCVGKTTTLDYLKSGGFPVVDEPARDIIKEELAKKEQDSSYDLLLPSTHFAEFQKKVIEEQVRREAAHPQSLDKLLLDASLIDCIGYSAAWRVPPPEKLFQLIKDAGYAHVFFLERLNAYTNDAERKEGLAFAKKVTRELWTAYNDLGFSPIIVPSFDNQPRERAELVRRFLYTL